MRRLAALLLLLAAPAGAEALRVATFNASLSRQGPGLLLADILDRDPQVLAAAEVILAVRPDILLLNEFDRDHDAVALAAFRALLAEGVAGLPGIGFGHAFAGETNTGEPSFRDLDGDGDAHGPADSFGFGSFPGQFGMALLSRHPIDAGAIRSFRLLPRAALPDARLPRGADGTPFPSAAAQAVMRLSSKSHWDVPVDVAGSRLHILAAHPTPPVFDGPEDANGLRNHDEIALWSHYLDGLPLTDDSGRSAPFAGGPFVLLGDMNADPFDGDGLHDGIRALLSHHRIRDPRPASDGAAAAAREQGGPNGRHAGPPDQDTADFREDGGPGNLRADYALPASTLAVTGSGVFWPAPGQPHAEAAAAASDHRMVWVDITLP
jgi:endonuclease/exonuclease/phosphatase family metal-dependent hydrolase